jgi:hypothetical protein
MPLLQAFLAIKWLTAKRKRPTKATTQWLQLIAATMAVIKGGAKKNNGKGNDESKEVLPMVKMEDLTKTNELLNFGYCDDICDSNRDKFVFISSVCDRAYDMDEEEAKKKLLENLFYDSAQDESNESQLNRPTDESNEFESNM